MHWSWSDPRSLVSASAPLDAGFERLFALLERFGPAGVPKRARAARESGRAEGTFKREFPVAAGMTWSRFVHRWRMENGRDWLRENAGTLKEVAVACGYGSTRAFSVAYRAHFGKPPPGSRREPICDLFGPTDDLEGRTFPPSGRGRWTPPRLR